MNHITKVPSKYNIVYSEEGQITTDYKTVHSYGVKKIRKQLTYTPTKEKKEKKKPIIKNK